jgi:hypothetical protein
MTYDAGDGFGRAVVVAALVGSDVLLAVLVWIVAAETSGSLPGQCTLSSVTASHHGNSR